MSDLSSYISAVLAVLLFTSFVKIYTGLSILRLGIGLQGMGMSLIFCVLAFALALFSVHAIPGGSTPFRVLLGEGKGSDSYEKTFKPLLEKKADPTIRAQLEEVAKKNSNGVGTVDASAVLLAASVISELKDALKIGLLFLIPFLLIDVLVTNVLASLNVTQISAALISLPLKLLLFISVNGWNLVIEKLLTE